MSRKRFTSILCANRQLTFLNCEKQKRASELLIANLELIFQNSEKEKRAEELLIANKELIFENSEKEKRAVELALAYADLQKIEKSQKEYIMGLEKMVFMVSHEVRQPLAQILGLSSLVEQLNEADPLKKMLGYLRQSAGQLDVFTRKLAQYLHNLVEKVKYKK